jgi:hypothetical protein
MAMKILGVVAMTAALVATQAFTQNAFAQSSGSETERASQREHAVSHRSDARHHARAERHVEGRRGSGSFASTPEYRESRADRGRGGSSAFDGPWSVLILTQSGACDRSYRYGVEIRNGEVLNAGGAPVDLAGRVAPNGAVRVTVAAGGQEAHGAGRLSRTSGGGRWEGHGSAGTCAGIWQAERHA